MKLYLYITIALLLSTFIYADCYDRQLNGDETDIDCGGSCRSCIELGCNVKENLTKNVYVGDYHRILSNTHIDIKISNFNRRLYVHDNGTNIFYSPKWGWPLDTNWSYTSMTDDYNLKPGNFDGEGNLAVWAINEWLKPHYATGEPHEFYNVIFQYNSTTKQVSILHQRHAFVTDEFEFVFTDGKNVGYVVHHEDYSKVYILPTRLLFETPAGQTIIDIKATSEYILTYESNSEFYLYNRTSGVRTKLDLKYQEGIGVYMDIYDDFILYDKAGKNYKARELYLKNIITDEDFYIASLPSGGQIASYGLDNAQLLGNSIYAWKWEWNVKYMMYNYTFDDMCVSKAVMTDFRMLKDSYSFENPRWDKWHYQSYLKDKYKREKEKNPQYSPLLYLWYIWMTKDGYCYGMASSTQMYYDDVFPVPAGKDDIFHLTPEEAMPFIVEMQLNQIDTVALFNLFTFPIINRQTQLQKIIQAIDDNRITTTMFHLGNGVGHTVNIHGYKKTSTGYLLYMYDNSVPNMTDVSLPVKWNGDFDLPVDLYYLSFDPAVSFSDEDLQRSLEVQNKELGDELDSRDQILVTVNSPVDIKIGGGLRIVDNQVVENSIGAKVLMSDFNRVFLLPVGDYEIVLEGYDSGPVNMNIMDGSNVQVYDEYEVEEGSLVRAMYQKGTRTDFSLDIDGDGVSEETLIPQVFAIQEVTSDIPEFTLVSVMILIFFVLIFVWFSRGP